MDTCAPPPAGSHSGPRFASLQRYRARALARCGARHDPELGHFALILALAVALVQGTLPFVGASRGDIRLMALGRTAALTQALLVILAFAALTQAYVTSDFSVANVVANSHSAKPLLYKISGVWGNHEGSMLLWALILALFGAAVALFGNNLPDSLRARVLGVQALIGAGFLAFILFTSNPFERLSPAPPDGNGLNPLLQDPGLAFHPPLLYLGYVGLLGNLRLRHRRAARRTSGRRLGALGAAVDPGRLVLPDLRHRARLVVGLLHLRLGAASGSGIPVENASLMPWLAGTALLHSAIVVEKRDALKSWTVLLAILAFRSACSAPSWCARACSPRCTPSPRIPARGIFILAFLLLVTGGGSRSTPGGAEARARRAVPAVSREGALILNNLLLCTLAATVLLGTLYPLFLDL
jgi:cytochrome c-type biogenesis protein CcmF